MHNQCRRQGTLQKEQKEAPPPPVHSEPQRGFSCSFHFQMSPADTFILMCHILSFLRLNHISAQLLQPIRFYPRPSLPPLFFILRLLSVLSASVTLSDLKPCGMQPLMKNSRAEFSVFSSRRPRRVAGGYLSAFWLLLLLLGILSSIRPPIQLVFSSCS